MLLGKVDVRTGVSLNRPLEDDQPALIREAEALLQTVNDVLDRFSPGQDALIEFAAHALGYLRVYRAKVSNHPWNVLACGEVGGEARQWAAERAIATGAGIEDRPLNRVRPFQRMA